MMSITWTQLRTFPDVHSTSKKHSTIVNKGAVERSITCHETPELYTLNDIELLES
jgi:hypothetical protein